LDLRRRRWYCCVDTDRRHRGCSSLCGCCCCALQHVAPASIGACRRGDDSAFAQDALSSLRLQGRWGRLLLHVSAQLADGVCIVVVTVVVVRMHTTGAEACPSMRSCSLNHCIKCRLYVTGTGCVYYDSGGTVLRGAGMLLLHLLLLLCVECCCDSGWIPLCCIAFGGITARQLCVCMCFCKLRVEGCWDRHQSLAVACCLSGVLVSLAQACQAAITTLHMCQ